jgi:heme/copper-type cytochrome/quinol oxidase subunit 2
VAENFVILVVIAALAGGFALMLFTAMWRVERSAQFGREAGIKRSQRLERGVFLIGVVLVVAMVTVVVTVQLSRAPGCRGTLVMVAGSDGRPLECACEEGRRGACFDPGP